MPAGALWCLPPSAISLRFRPSSPVQVPLLAYFFSSALEQLRDLRLQSVRGEVQFREGNRPTSRG
jgi:hypothetical protein